MFDVGFTEIFLIGIVSLIVIGPERLPAVAKTVGQWVGKLQRFVKGVKTDLASEMETGDLKKLIGDQREQINELRDMVSTARTDIQSTARSMMDSTQEGLSELENSVNDAKSDNTDCPEDRLNAARTDAKPALDHEAVSDETEKGVPLPPEVEDTEPGNTQSKTGADNQ